MDNDLFERGLEQRKATLGAEYVEKNLAAAEAIVDLMEGRRPKLLVNPEALDQPQLRAQLK